MTLDYVFTSFIYQEDVSLDNDALKVMCNNIIDKTTNQGWIMNGDWNSMSPETWEAVEPLFNLIREKTNYLHKHLGFKDSYTQIVKECWANLNHTYNTFQIHQHPGAFFSGCYYVSADDESGSLEFVNPVPAQVHVVDKEWIEVNNHYNSGTWSVKPKTGKLVIFPPWMAHYVNLNNSECDRISIAFNTKILPL